MSLRITRLRLSDFRNYEALELEPDPELTLLVGANAVGKTNIMEALELLTVADSFRRPRWAEVVRWGQDSARVWMRAEGDGRVLETELEVSASGRRTFKINGKTRRRLAQVAGIIPCVVFTPDDLRLVKDSPDRRRGAIDEVGDQLSPAYATARLDYERILRQRNSLLKNPGSSSEEAALWSERLATAGASFSGHRRRLFDRIAPKMSGLYASLAAEERLSATYVHSWDRGQGSGAASALESMQQAMDARAAEEVARGVSLVGPHRDDVVFEIEGRDARDFASQGQQRTIALAWKLAEVQVISEIAGQPPVLLLDDVMSELDEPRRHALAESVGRATQTFISTTNLGYFEKRLTRRAKVVSLG